jgi:NADPH:quinone reductase-like Zn-dependent oxidoreductase
MTACVTRCPIRRQQYVVMPEEDLVAVPDQMDDQTAAQFYVRAMQQ